MIVAAGREYRSLNNCRKDLDVYTCNVPVILEMIWQRKTNFAYIIPESKLSIMNAPHMWTNNHCAFRVLNEIFCGCRTRRCSGPS